MFYPVTVTGSYSINSEDPRFAEQSYIFEIKLEHGKYIGTIERPTVEYINNGKTTTEELSSIIESIEGTWSHEMKAITIDFPHVENLRAIDAKSDNNFRVELQTLP